MINPITVENELPGMNTEQLRELQDIINQDMDNAFRLQDIKTMEYLRRLDAIVIQRIDYLEFAL